MRLALAKYIHEMLKASQVRLLSHFIENKQLKKLYPNDGFLNRKGVLGNTGLHSQIRAVSP